MFQLRDVTTQNIKLSIAAAVRTSSMNLLEHEEKGRKEYKVSRERAMMGRAGQNTRRRGQMK
jgi:hypothetical protein